MFSSLHIAVLRLTACCFHESQCYFRRRAQVTLWGSVHPYWGHMGCVVYVSRTVFRMAFSQASGLTLSCMTHPADTLQHIPPMNVYKSLRPRICPRCSHTCLWEVFLMRPDTCFILVWLVGQLAALYLKWGKKYRR